jgi:hypothetical protein
MFLKAGILVHFLNSFNSRASPAYPNPFIAIKGIAEILLHLKYEVIDVVGTRSQFNSTFADIFLKFCIFFDGWVGFQRYINIYYIIHELSGFGPSVNGFVLLAQCF